MYRKLKNEELETILQKLLSKKNSVKYPQLFKLVKEYFADKAFYAVISFDSEYDDQYYENKFQSITVYDKNDNLVSINRNNYEKFKEKAENLDFGNSSEDNKPMEDIVIYFETEIPELYIKE